MIHYQRQKIITCVDSEDGAAWQLIRKQKHTEEKPKGKEVYITLKEDAEVLDEVVVVGYGPDLSPALCHFYLYGCLLCRRGNLFSHFLWQYG